MANWFETVTKTLADDKLSRRKALQKAAGAAAGIALAALIPGEAFAASDTCTPPGNCSIGFATCGHNEFGNCNCYTKHGTGIRASQCGCNVFCSQVQNCAKSSDCPAGSFCAFFSGCDCTGSTGFCVPKCTHTCQLGAAHVGATSAPR